MTKIMDKIKEKTKSIKKRVTKRKPSKEQVSNKAYERFEQRGYCHGSDLDDWYYAEKELSEN